MDTRSPVTKLAFIALAILSTGAGGIGAWTLYTTYETTNRVTVLEVRSRGDDELSQTLKALNTNIISNNTRLSIIETQCSYMRSDITEIKTDVKAHIIK